MTISVWLLGVVLFWIVARFTIMRYDNLNSTELVMLGVVSLVPGLNFVMVGMMILLMLVMVSKQKFGELSWVEGKFVWKKAGSDE